MSDHSDVPVMASPAAVPGQRRLSVDEYHRMIAAGILGEDERVELVDGILIAGAPPGPRHARIIQRLNRKLVRRLSDDYSVLPQLPLTLDARSEPEPDLSVVRAEDASSDERHPASALLVIEVSHKSLGIDRSVEAALYARAAVAEYWIVNIPDDEIDVYREPDVERGRYRNRSTYGRGERLAPVHLGDFQVEVDEILGPSPE